MTQQAQRWTKEMMELVENEDFRASVAKTVKDLKLATFEEWENRETRNYLYAVFASQLIVDGNPFKK